MPVVDSRDLIAIPASGAYCLAMASNYNAAPRPPIVMVKDGEPPPHPPPGDLPGPHALRSVIDARASGTASNIHGHDGVLNLLYTAAQADRLAHAYVLVGPPHVGKMTLAVHLAQLVNCEAPTPGPCLTCNQCKRIAAGNHADVQITGLPTTEEGALGTQIRIEQVRELRKQASLRPYEGRTRVFIIQDSELLTNEAANSLLKYLEEPPPNVLLALLASDEDALLPTVSLDASVLSLGPCPLHPFRTC